MVRSIKKNATFAHCTIIITMKKYTLPLIALSLCSMAATAVTPDWANFARYSGANDSIAALPTDPSRTVMMGNSITQIWPGYDRAFFTDNNLVCRGISGQTSYQMLSRFRDDVVRLRPATVVICAGTNDIAENSHPYSEERTLGNIMSMAEIARANNIRVVLASVPPAVAFPWRKEIENVGEKIISLNRRIKEYAADNGLTYIDYHSALAGSDGLAPAAGLTTDGVHPSLAGFRIMEAELLKALSNK